MAKQNKLIVDSLVNLLKSNNDLTALTSVISGNPVKFTNSKTNNKCNNNVYLWCPNIDIIEIASQNYFAKGNIDIVIHCKTTININAFDKIQEIWFQIVKIINEKEWSGLSLSEFYIDDKSKVIDVTVEDMNLPAMTEQDDQTTAVLIEGNISILMNYWN
jgi:hypothetical protein